MKNIPINPQLLLKVWIFVILAIVAIAIIAVIGFDYEVTNADFFGAPVASILIAYIIHLALWKPGE